MQYFTLLTLALATAVSALPQAESPDVGGQAPTLVSSKGTSSVQVGDYNSDLQARSLYARTAVPNCKGSSFCSNDQSFKNQCSQANKNLQPTTYTSGGDKAGVCSGGCGLFVQGKKDRNGNACAASGDDLANGFQQLLSNGCQACGSVAAPAGGDCIITVNYVSGCAA